MKFKYETWRKLYAREEGSFARLPWFARAAAGMLLKICDEAGRIEVGDQKLADVVAFRMGATTGDRRMMHKLMPLLEVDRYIVRKGSYYVIRNFVAAQRNWSIDETVASQPPTPNESDASGERTERESDVSQTRVVNESDVTDELKHGNDSTLSGVPILPSVPNDTKEETDKTSPAEAGSSAPNTVVPEKSPRKKNKVQPSLLDDSPPEPGTPARAVYDAIVRDTFLSGIVAGPAEFARRVSQPEAYPGVMVASEIMHAAEVAVSNGRTYKDGNAYLRNWLKRALEAAQRRPGIAKHAIPEAFAFDVKAALEALDEGIGTETPAFASPAEQAALREIATGSSPKMEVDDFRILGRAIRAGVMDWLPRPVSLSFLVKHLSSAMTQALSWEQIRLTKLAAFDREQAARDSYISMKEKAS